MWAPLPGPGELPIKPLTMELGNDPHAARLFPVKSLGWNYHDAGD